MEEDSDRQMDDIDSSLLNRFSSMGTTDKDILISQFQSLLGFQLNPSGCAFFLDMTNWNLQSAIGAYYDFEGAPQSKVPLMSFLCDVTIGEGEAVPPNTNFVKTWKIQNMGDEQWPSGCCLRFIQGEKMSASNFVAVPSAQPRESIEIAVSMVSPSLPGIYQGQWRMHTVSGTPFGEIIWVIITVQQDGLLDITQQISKIASDLGSREEAVEVYCNAHSSNSMEAQSEPMSTEMLMDEQTENNNSWNKNSSILSSATSDKVSEQRVL